MCYAMNRGVLDVMTHFVDVTMCDDVKRHDHIAQDYQHHIVDCWRLEVTVCCSPVLL